MGSPRNSIAKRIRAIILLTSVMVLLATAGAFTLYEVINFKSQLVRNLYTLATVVADNSAAAVAFNQPSSAQDVLAALRVEQDIKLGVLYDTNGTVFATYPVNADPTRIAKPVAAPHGRFQDGALLLSHPVMKDGKVIGTLYLRRSLEGLYKQFWRFGEIVAGVLIGSSVMAFFLSSLLQQRISLPILALTHAAQTVAEHEDYSVRAPKLTDDELGTLTDAFNRMLAETQEHHEMIRTEAERLDRLVAQRTARLQETIGELEAFSYSISHDMRAPLRAMQGYAKALAADYADKLDATANLYLDRIARAANRLDLLVQDVLAYSRVTKGDIALHRVNLETLIRDILPHYPEFQPPKAQITIQTPLHTVIGHEAYLTQCITNLLGNAVKFVADGVTPQICIWTERAEGKVRLWIEDNGIGVDPAHRDRIFQIFGQVHPSKKYGGTGIGLAIVRKAAQRMGGDAGFQSELGKGSRFWIALDEK